MIHEIPSFDIIFLSYDEPNAEKNWADLLTKAPWAARVHGVKGFDSAHRACAERSATDWFITVDGDTTVRPSFFDHRIEFDPEHDPLTCFSWNAENQINGLIYGNGGLKLWSKAFVLSMNTHENADDPRKAVDFCWESNYHQQPEVFGDVWNNASPFQAFRAGFREGVKLALDRGRRISPHVMKSSLHPVNLRNLKIWCSVGADVENGCSAIMGARLGFSKMLEDDFDYTIVSDYDKIYAFYQSPHDLPNTVVKTIKEQTGIVFPELNAEASEFFRETFRLRNL